MSGLRREGEELPPRQPERLVEAIARLLPQAPARKFQFNQLNQRTERERLTAAHLGRSGPRHPAGGGVGEVAVEAYDAEVHAPAGADDSEVLATEKSIRRLMPSEVETVAGQKRRGKSMPKAARRRDGMP